MFALLITALTDAATSLAPYGDVSTLYEEVESFFREAEQKKELSDEVVFAFVRFYANRGLMQECVACVVKYLELLTSTVESFEKTMNLLISVAGRDVSLILDAAGTSNAKGVKVEVV